jgi:hypothetical protein
MTGNSDDLALAINALRMYRDTSRKLGLELDFLRASVAAGNISLRTEADTHSETDLSVTEAEKLRRAYSVLRDAVARIIEQSKDVSVESDELRSLATRSESVFRAATDRAVGQLRLAF